MGRGGDGDRVHRGALHALKRFPGAFKLLLETAPTMGVRYGARNPRNHGKSAPACKTRAGGLDEIQQGHPIVRDTSLAGGCKSKQQMK